MAAIPSEAILDPISHTPAPSKAAREQILFKANDLVENNVIN